MKNILKRAYLPGKRRITLMLLSLLMIGIFSMKTIVSDTDSTANTILNVPSQHNNTGDNTSYYHSVRHNHWNNDDGGHDDRDSDEDVYNKDDRDEEGRENNDRLDVA